MTSTSLGGASSAVAASAHAACARFRSTDPLVVGRTRRKLAADVGFADDSGRIPEARWMRAMTSAAAWSRLPSDMSVHSYGVLAAPRNAFLQPEALVELLDDHRAEVRMRVAERRTEAAESAYGNSTGITEFVAHLRATFDPATCTTCTLFSHCRNELRTSDDPADLLAVLRAHARRPPDQPSIGRHPSGPGGRRCHAQLLALANPQAADDLATDASVREVAVATVVQTSPLVLDVASRRITVGSRIVLLHVNEEACVEHPSVEVAAQIGSFKFTGLSIGPLSTAGNPDWPRRLSWAPAINPTVSVGDRLLVADFAWFCSLKKDTALSVNRPKVDDVSAPKVVCEPDSYAEDPDAHQYCCRSHEDSEADWSDQLAARRARRELNPQTWPPVVDGDAFEAGATGAPTGNAATEPPETPPDDITMDDLE